MEICALFSNILDNAIEANQKISEGAARWIKLGIARKGQMLVIAASNPKLEGKLKWAGKIPQTTKRDKEKHGMGMQSIMQVLEMHKGYLIAEDQGAIFQLTVYLQGFDD